MNENNMNTDQQQGTQQGAPTQPEENGGTERMFTQEDVNRIVQDRLAREREKDMPLEIEQREQAIAAREAALDCREFAATLQIDGRRKQALLDNLDTSDVDRFKDAAQAIVDAFSPHYEPPAGGSPNTDSIASAFKPKF